MEVYFQSSRIKEGRMHLYSLYAKEQKGNLRISRIFRVLSIVFLLVSVLCVWIMERYKLVPIAFLVIAAGLFYIHRLYASRHRDVAERLSRMPGQNGSK